MQVLDLTNEEAQKTVAFPSIVIKDVRWEKETHHSQILVTPSL